MKTETVTSLSNPLLKQVRKAIARGRVTDEGFAVAEGFHLLEEALRSDRPVHAILATESVHATVAAHVKGLASGKFYTLPDSLFNQVSSTETTQGVIALVDPPAWTLEQALRDNALVVILDGVQEPGNAGAIVRSAEAFGATGVVFLKGSANPYNPKSIRASAGSIFRVPCVHGVEAPLLVVAAGQRRIELMAAMPGEGTDLPHADLTQNCGLIIGSEGRGVSSEMNVKSSSIKIPTTGVESLNAAVAAGILLYEARRQRMRLR